MALNEALNTIWRILMATLNENIMQKKHFLWIIKCISRKELSIKFSSCKYFSIVGEMDWFISKCSEKNSKWECIPVGCVPPAAVAVPGASTRHPPWSRPPPPWEQTPPEQTPSTRSRQPPRADTSREQNSWQTPLKILPCPKLFCGR